MSLPEFSMRQLIECGVHYGHQSHRWNPLMGEFIHSKRNGIHIIDLTKTVPLLDAALHAVFETVSKGGSILFVGTKRQAQKPVAEAAGRCAQFYINQRWLGGTLTNWHTVSNSISRLKSIDEKLESGVEGLTKRELLGMRREQAKLQASLGGIRDMKSLPDMLFVVDVKKEALAVAEAKKLGIPVVAVVDTNCSPDGVTFLVPGNDDASRAINLYCELFAGAALSGLQHEMRARGEDPGESTVVDAGGELSADASPEPSAEDGAKDKDQDDSEQNGSDDTPSATAGDDSKVELSADASPESATEDGAKDKDQDEKDQNGSDDAPSATAGDDSEVELSADASPESATEDGAKDKDQDEKDQNGSDDAPSATAGDDSEVELPVEASPESAAEDGASDEVGDGKDQNGSDDAPAATADDDLAPEEEASESQSADKGDDSDSAKEDK